MLLLLFAIVVAVQAGKALDFVEGFGIGVEADFGNLTECMDETTLTFEDMEKGFEDLEYGITHLDVGKIAQGIQEWADGLHEITIAIKDCGDPEIVAKIQTLIAEIKEGGSGLIKIVVHEVVQILTHGKDLTTDFKNMIDYWKQGQFKLSGYYCGKLVGILLEGV